MDKNLIITNATLVTPVGRSARRGPEMGCLVTTEHATIVVSDGIITYAGPSEDYAVSDDTAYTRIDAADRVVLPGFVDSHTHLIFGGYRPDEFGWRLNGESYMSIMQRGGGIQSTVNATRSASAEELVEKAQWFIDRMSEMGDTDRKQFLYGMLGRLRFQLLRA